MSSGISTSFALPILSRYARSNSSLSSVALIYKTAFQREIASLSEQSDEFRKIEMFHKKELTKMFTSVLSVYKDKLKIKDMKTVSYIILTTVEAAVHDTMFHKGGKNKKAVIRELTAMIVEYLF